MTDRPWLKFYTADWRADPRLRSCSLAARGLWMEMLCLMHEAEPYGHLLINGRPVGDRQLAALCGAVPDELAAAKAELDAAGVFSLGDGGVVFSRRMVRDKAKSDQGREWGKRGGNPALKPPPPGPALGGPAAGKPPAGGLAAGALAAGGLAVGRPAASGPSAGRLAARKSAAEPAGDAPAPRRRATPGVNPSRARGPESRNQTPDPVGSDTPGAGAPGARPLDLKARLYGDCRLWLEQAAGLAEARARAQIGKWLKGGGREQRLIAAFLEAQRCSAADPIPYITRLMQAADDTAPAPGPPDRTAPAAPAARRVSRLAHLRNKRRKRDQGIAYLSADEEAELAALEADEAGAARGAGAARETDPVGETGTAPEAADTAPDPQGPDS